MSYENETALKEILDRTRRLETRFTSYLAAQGMNTGSVRPTFKAHRDNQHVTIHCESIHVTLAQIVQFMRDNEIQAAGLVAHNKPIGALAL